MRFKTLLYCSFFFLCACAQIITISGGEKDTTPPKLIEEETFPKNETINFKANEIKLTFDEYFTVSNPKQKVSISPSVENDLEFTLKGKTLTVKINNTLEENTTYTINFGEAIKDYNANNVLKNFTYVFSTGNYIDSMEVSGKVLEAKTNNPMEGVTVGLYKTYTDSIVSQNKPFYYTTTDTKGKFSLQNIKNGKYKVFALKDENRNLLFDLPNEQVAYQDSLIKLDTANAENIELKIFEEDYKKQSITSKTFEYPGKLTLTFQRPTDSVAVSFIDEQIKVIYAKTSLENDTAIYWLKNTPSKRFSVLVKADTLRDTIAIYPFKKPKTKDTLINLKTITTNIDIENPVTLQFSEPIARFDSTRIKVLQDSTPVNISKIDIDTLDKHKMLVFFGKKHAEKYQVSLYPNVVTNLYQSSFNDTVVKVVSVYEKDYYGSLYINLKNTTDNVDYWLRLKQGDATIKIVKDNNGNFTFDKLPPNTYTLEVLVDRNKNGKWDTGNYYKKIKPEQILNYPKKLEVRSNWELSEKWDLQKVD